MTPAEATRYVERMLPDLLARAARQLGEPGPDGAVAAAPSAGAARLALLSAAEILDQLGPQLPADVLVPQRAALTRLQQAFVAQHPSYPLAMPRRDRPATMAERVADAWEAGAAEAGAPAPPHAGAPDAGLPARSSALE